MLEVVLDPGGDGSQDEAGNPDDRQRSALDRQRTGNRQDWNDRCVDPRDRDDGEGRRPPGQQDGQGDLPRRPSVEETEVIVRASSSPKCERCWHYRADVGHDPAHPTICGRCTANLFGAGEPRTIA